MSYTFMLLKNKTFLEKMVGIKYAIVLITEIIRKSYKTFYEKSTSI